MLRLSVRNRRGAIGRATELEADKIDWSNGVLVYRRKKLGEDSEPAPLTIGKKLREILRDTRSLDHSSQK